MAEMKEHPLGTFCWADLATTDAEAGKKFYAGLFGWQWADMPAGPSVYTMFSKGGKNVCALYSMNEEMRKQGGHRIGKATCRSRVRTRAPIRRRVLAVT